METKSVVDLGYSSKGSWAGYSVNLAGAGKYSLRANVATDESGSLTFKLDGSPICTLQVSKTGGWDSWTVKELSNVQIPRSGPARLRVEWGDGGKVNLDWIEFSATGVSVIHPERSVDISYHAVAGGLDVELGPTGGTIALTDLQGRILTQTGPGTTKAHLAVRSGAAILRVRTPDGVRTERVVVP